MSRLAQVLTIIASIATVLCAALIQHLVMLGTTLEQMKLVVPTSVGFLFGVLLVAVLRTRAALKASLATLARQQGQISALNERLSQTVRSQGQELKSAERQLVEANRLGNVGLLASGVAHDFNNLLTVVLSGAAWLLDEAKGERQEVLEGILSAGERGATLTQQLLALSRPPRAGEDLEVHCLNRALQQLEPLLGRLAGGGVQVTVKRSEQELAVRLTRARIEQVLINLVVNARDAMPDGGRVTLETRSLGTRGELRVTDTGFGMSPEVQARIFEPFFTTKGAGRGTGLGLAVVMDAVQCGAGDIAVDSKPSGGTTFTLSFPLHSGEALDDTPRSLQRPPEGGVVLFVDEDDALRRLVVTLLDAAHLRVITASGQRDALEKVEQLEREHVSFVLVADLLLADGDGVSLAHEALRRSSQLRVVLTSTHGLPEIDLPAVLLPKPFTAARLLDAVHLASLSA